MKPTMRPMIFLFVVGMVQISSCDGANRQRQRQNMEKPTIPPTFAPTVPPTNFPTRNPTELPTLFPTAYPTEKKSMERSPIAIVAPTSPPVVDVAPVAAPTAPVVPAPTAPTPVAVPTVTTTMAPTILGSSSSSPPPTTLAPTTIEPTVTPTALPTLASEAPTATPSALPSSSPSGEPSSSPIASTNVPTSFPTPEPTYSNITSSLALREFSILLLSFENPVINVEEVETALEQYLYQNMMLENMIDLSLTPVAASSVPGYNFTSTSIRFAGESFFIIEVPTQAALNATQDGVILSKSATVDINTIINKNSNLIGVRAVDISYGQLDPKSVVSDERPVEESPTKDTSTDVEQSSKNNTGLVIGLVFMFATFLVVGAAYIIYRRRRLASRRDSAKPVDDTTKPTPSVRKAADSFYPSLRRQYPDIEKPKEESVKTPNEEEDDDESESAADLSSYMMTPTGSQVTETRVTSNNRDREIFQARTVVQEHPTVEISVSHIAEVADDEDYTSTDDASGKFATDMSECTFK